MWKVPLFNVDLDKQEADAVRDIVNSGWLTMGETTKKFERKFAEFLNIRHAIAVSSCTAALHMANLALGIGKNDEVICPSLTFVAGTNSILYTGAKPVFADVKDVGDLNISPEDIKTKITKKTRAIQIMHYAGFPCDMDRIMDIAKRNKLSVVEDCAHAAGSLYRGKKCGVTGNIGCFSFFSNKNMTTGEGGMVVTNDDEIAKKLKFLRSHGMTTLTLDRHQGHAFDYDVVTMGFNYRIDELRSAIGIAQLEKLRKNNIKRKELVELYRKELSAASGISVPFRKNRGLSSNYIFPVLLKRDVNRAEFMEHMKNHGIQTSIHYPPVHLFSFYKRYFGYKEGLLPVTEDAAKREVTLPLYPSMKKDDVYYVCKTAAKFFKKTG